MVESIIYMGDKIKKEEKKRRWGGREEGREREPPQGRQGHLKEQECQYLIALKKFLLGGDLKYFTLNVNGRMSLIHLTPL